MHPHYESRCVYPLTSAFFGPMAEKDISYRKLIVERLERVKQRNKQVAAFYNNYSKLADQLEKKQSYGPIRSSANLQETEEFFKVKEEMAELYRSKCQNDQMLINANHKIVELEKKTSVAVNERDSLESRSKILYEKYAEAEVDLQKLRADRDNMNDERIALVTTVNMLTQQKLEMENDRIHFLNKIRELNNQRVDLMNAEIALEEQRRNLRIQDQIRSAVQDVSKDQRVMAMLQAMPDTNSNGDLLMGDSVPSYIELSFECDEGEVNDVLWLSGETFATAGSDRKVKIWKVDGHGGQSKIDTLPGSNAAFTRLDYDRDRRHLIASSNDNNVRIWNLESSRLLSTLSGHADQVTCVKFYQSHSAASGSADRVIKIWDLQNQRCSRSFFPGSKVYDIATNLGGSPSLFSTGHFDKKLRFWDGRSTDAVKTIEMGGRITSLDASMSGYELLISTRDDTITLMDLRNFQTIHCYSAENYRTSSDLSRVVLSSGNDYVAAGSANGNIYVWNRNSTKLEKRLTTATDNPIFSISWNPTGYGMLSSSKQKVVALWK
ncbi:unnamed protein product [Caenorhabditis sp. 36 PRJEB53466]|nr:unnamed protein product [Caenorhabditis sp. 36 PRJEB53466]